MNNIIKFVFVGPESTGKTTLCKHLAEHYSTNWVKEMCRVLAEEKTTEINPDINAEEINFNFTINDFVEMANRQNEEEYKLSQTANKVLFCDNDAFALTIWTERYLGKYYDEIYDIYKNADYLNNDEKIYILTKPNVPFVQDGLRDGEHIRDWMYERFLEELENRNMTYYVVGSSKYDERCQYVMNIVKHVI
jgi:NadR type nicotinamide-nucleotide adenylyltransferase